MGLVFSFLYWTFVAATSIVLFVGALTIWLLTAGVDRDRRWLHIYTCWWAQLYLRCLPGCHVQVDGRERIAQRTPHLLLANHQSKSDLMALSFLAVPFKWVGQKEVFRYPFIGWNAYLNGYVSVDRGNIRTVGRTMADCRRWLDRGIPLMMFPEGGRSRTGELRRFRSGAFKLAVQCDCAVIPIVVDGTRPVYRGARVAAFPGRISIRVLEPITPSEAGGNHRILRDLTFQHMQKALAGIRGGVSALM